MTRSRGAAVPMPAMTAKTAPLAPMIPFVGSRLLSDKYQTRADAIAPPR